MSHFGRPAGHHRHVGLRRLVIKFGEQVAARFRVIQQVFEGLFLGQGIEESLVIERGGEEALAFVIGEGSGGIAAQQMPNFRGHEGFLGSPVRSPIRSRSCWRQRWSQV